jgi:N-acetylglucosamine kinase-like BadF-type ATPase
MTNSQDFFHPLSTLETIDTAEGKKKVINSWAFASMIWSTALAGNEKALGIVNELFSNKDEIATFLSASKAGNEAATRGALAKPSKRIAIIAFALDEKIAEAFEEKS